MEGPSGSWSYGSWIYNYLCYQCPSPLMLWVRIPLRRGVFNTILCDELCQWLAADRWFSPGTPVSSTNKCDRHDTTEILLKVSVNAITLSPCNWTVVEVIKWKTKIPHCRNNSKIPQCRNNSKIPQCRNNSKIN